LRPFVAVDDHMKKSMPSMSMQARMIQPAAQCTAGVLAELDLVRYAD
jgi:hypothetical protein